MEVGKQKIMNESNNNFIIVSITSFKPRIIDNSLLNALKSIITQKFNGQYKICLTLAKNDMQYISNELDMFFKKHNIELIIDDIDVKSHKKYYYVMKKYKEYPIITIDDDSIYDNDLIQTLTNAYKKFPNCVISRRCHLITHDVYGKIQSYRKWKYSYTKLKNQPSDLLFATGVGGILYPINAIDVEDISINDMLTCENDDMILKSYEQIHNIKTVYTSGKTPFGYIAQKSSYDKYALCYKNIGKDRCDNDIYIERFNIK